MKRISRLIWQAILCSALLAVAPACDVLHQESPDSFSPDDVFGSASRTEQAVVGMYDAMQNAEFYGGRVLIYSDIRTDDTEPSGFFGGISQSNPSSSDGNVEGAWQGGYRSMYTANYIMRELTRRGSAVPISAEKAANYMGEAKFLRALCHFTLVNLFAQPYNYTSDASHLGIPIQLDAPDGAEAFSTSQRLPRASVRDVYAQIEKDLLEAIQELPDTYGKDLRVDISRATKDAAKGLLSRVYLYKGDYEKAARYSGEIITGGLHTLRDSPESDFLATATDLTQDLTNESIFFIAMNQVDNPNTNNAIGQHYSPPPGRGDILVTPFQAAIPATDKRASKLLLRRSGRWWTKKYSTDLGGPNSGAWVPVVRYPEIILNRAEALAKTSATPSAEAVDLLNQIRDRSKPAAAPSYTVASFATPNDLVEAILRERRYELAFEGHRLFDLLRNKKDVPATTVGAAKQAVPYGSTRSIFPIPAKELQRNPNITQNDGY